VSASRASFSYWRDPVWVATTAAYVVNRWIVPASLQPAWWRGHFSDLLLVPVGLPIWLWIERRLGWRTHDDLPRWTEIAFVLVTWTVAAELLAPRLFAHATGDVWDVAAYGCGAAAVGLSWQWLAA
jgi:hypothetical protein